jgi:hypothetical protein
MTAVMTRMARQWRLSRLANGPLMARTLAITINEQGPASGTTAWSWAFVVERVTKNRTRTVSLGICAARASIRSELQGGLSVSDRERPVFTGVNGTLMARRPSSVSLR